MSDLEKKKVCIIGAHKTCTTSAEGACEILGFISTNWHWFKLPMRIKNRLYQGNFSGIDNYINSENYSLFKDSPYNYNDIYKYIYNLNNDIYFVLTIRDPEKWINTFIRWGKSTILNRKEMNYAYGVDIPTEENKDCMIERYNKRNNEIIEYFKENNGKLLVLNIEEEEDPWKPLCEFLDEPIPDKPFPHLNKNSES